VTSGTGFGDHFAQQPRAAAAHSATGSMESATGQRFSDRRHPLLVSVRSGAARSMPGMLDTVLNVGCTDDAMRGFIRTFGDPLTLFRQAASDDADRMLFTKALEQFYCGEPDHRTLEFFRVIG
jgi:hypothetical protein